MDVYRCEGIMPKGARGGPLVRRVVLSKKAAQIVRNAIDLCEYERQRSIEAGEIASALIESHDRLWRKIIN